MKLIDSKVELLEQESGLNGAFKQIELCGRTCKVQKRTKYTPNEIIHNGDGTCYIVLYNNKCESICKTLVDEDKIAELSSIKWCMTKDGYVQNSKGKYLHRIIMDNPELFVDHIDGNKLNNTISNLRICSNADNLKNRVNIPSNNTSGIVGVRFRKDRNKWAAEIQANKVRYGLGLYKTKEEAIVARLAGELKYFGEYKSRINEVNRQ